MKLKKLSKAYKQNTTIRYATCPNCKTIYEDDIYLYGSLYCPNLQCETSNGRYCLVRN